jgi:small basic protein (TIGR04137 family)
MSLHKSLIARSRLKRERNVLSRIERIAKLEDDGKWTEDDSVFALPKVRVMRLKKSHGKKKKKEEEEAEGVAGEAEAEAAAPAKEAGTKAKK